MNNYIKKLEEVLKEKTKFKNDIESNKLMTMGIQQNTAISQKPIIDAITKRNESNDSNQTLSLVEKAPKENKIFQIQPIDKISLEESYNLIKTTETISPTDSTLKFPVWKIKSNSKSNIGKFLLFKDDQGIEKIWQYSSLSEDAIELTEGLNEILFNNADDLTKTTDHDKNVYKLMIINSGLDSSFTNKAKIYKKLYSDIPQPPQIFEMIDTTGIGDGLHDNNKKEVIIIPENQDELREQLILQLQAQVAGHRNTFDHANAIMKKLMELKLLKSKDYRHILKVIYKI
jgi:hypothetical protein